MDRKCALDDFLARYRPFLINSHQYRAVINFELALRALRDFQQVDSLEEITPFVLKLLDIRLKAATRHPAKGPCRKVKSLQKALKQAVSWGMLAGKDNL